VGPRTARLVAAAPAAALLLNVGAAAQNGPVPAARVNVLIAENRRAAHPRDLGTLRTALRGRDAETARLAVRALGRLENPALIPDLLPALRFALPETRAEAATAVGQAAQGWVGTRDAAGARPGAAALSPATVLAALVERLDVEDDPAVRAALAETIGRLPYRTGDEAARAEQALLDYAARADSIPDRLGLARAVEAMVRVNRPVRAAGGGAVAIARALLGIPDWAAGVAVPAAGAAPLPELRLGPDATNTDPLRDARVRRLALEALITARAIDDDTVARSIQDADAQVRRLAMRAAGVTGRGLASLPPGLGDLSPIVRLEALRAVAAHGGASACAIAVDASSELEPHIALLAIDQLAGCGASEEAIAALDRAMNDGTEAGAARTWHQAAHALVAMAAAAPARAAAALGRFAASPIWQLRMYAARAAVALRDRAALETLARDRDDNVVETAVEGLSQVAGHAADGVYISALLRGSYPVTRAAALALRGTPDRARAVPPLQAALERLSDDLHDNSHDARSALAATLAGLGAAPRERQPRAREASPLLTAANLQRLAAPRARVAIRDVGTFELALFTSEAPATVLQFDPRRVRLLQRPHLSPGRAQFRAAGRQPCRQRVRRLARLHARRGRRLAARPRRGRHLHPRPRHRRRADLHRPGRQPASRSRIHRLRPGPERDRGPRSHPRGRRDRADRDHSLNRRADAMFSHRIESAPIENRLSRAVRQMRAEGRGFIDLTLSNPTRAGFAYPDDLLARFADPAALRYDPHPFGALDARAAVAADYARRGLAVSAERIALTASTSEAYGLLFKVLCDPGDEVLVPRPSYPLFEHLTRLDGVRPVAYDLEYHGAWTMADDSLDRGWSPRTRAVLLVNPNNPTGSFVGRAELDGVVKRCAARSAALIVDEVFADYELTPGAARAAGQALTAEDAVVFALGGLSKSIGLPQAKLAWIAAAGPEAAVADALARLELVCDTYLSVSTPVQVAAPDLLRRGAVVRAQIQRRVSANYAALAARAAQSPACAVLAAGGGWSAVLQVPSLEPEEDLVLRLLTRDGVLIHPGYFFDFPRESYLVASLLAPEAAFAEGVGRIFRHFDCSVTAVHG
jgi:aspartate/methionine/tyrosine aminotransferase